MADVAQAVGVSRQLVGLAIRNEPGVSSATATKIKNAAKTLGYSPNMAAQALRREGGKYIGVVFHTSHSSSEELIPSLYREAELRGFNVVLSPISKYRTDGEALAEIIGHRCVGVILISSALPSNKIVKLSSEFPLVSISRRLSGVKCSSISSAGEEGILKVTSYLIGLGHKNVSYVNTLGMNDYKFRMHGYKKAMRIANLNEDIINIQGDYEEVAGFRAAKKILERKTLPTAVICSNDQVALGLVLTLVRNGYSVPNDVSVTGFDDTIANFPFLDLTTIHQDASELASLSVEELTKRIIDPTLGPNVLLTSTELVLRTSTGNPRQE